MKQPSLFNPASPLVICYGVGVDSTAVLCLLEREKIRPDLILFANTGDEHEATLQYRATANEWLARVGFPLITEVSYKPKDFKNYPPYDSLSTNCLTNGTLPSLAFGFKSCSMKWKIAPQDAYLKTWEPALKAWEYGGKVRKMIGYDASPADRKRFAHAVGLQDEKCDYWYPLIERGIDRDGCKEIIAKAGLPIPRKSSCWHCPSTKPGELCVMTKEMLRRIVILEARAKPRLETIEGLWRTSVKGTRGGTKRPGSMTQYIVEQGLLPKEEVEELAARVPKEIIQNQQAFANGLEIPNWHDFLEAVTEEDAVGDPGQAAA